MGATPMRDESDRRAPCMHRGRWRGHGPRCLCVAVLFDVLSIYMAVLSHTVSGVRAHGGASARRPQQATVRVGIGRDSYTRP